MTLASIQYNHLPPGHPDNPKIFAICGSKTRQETSNIVCTQPAGWGTTHLGQGRCKLHGGRSPIGPNNPSYKHGRYARSFNAELKRHWEQIKAADDDPLDLIPELETLQAIYSYHLEHVFDPLVVHDKSGMVSLTTFKANMDGDDGAGADTGDDDGEMISESLMADGVGESGGRVNEDQIGMVSTIPPAEFLTVSSGGEKGGGLAPKIVQARFSYIKDLADTMVNLVVKVIAARNQTAITKAELIWLQRELVGLVNEFIPDPERRRAFIKRLLAVLPGGDDARGSGEGEGGNLLPAAAEASEAD